MHDWTLVRIRTAAPATRLGDGWVRVANGARREGHHFTGVHRAGRWRGGGSIVAVAARVLDRWLRRWGVLHAIAIGIAAIVLAVLAAWGAAIAIACRDEAVAEIDASGNKQP